MKKFLKIFAVAILATVLFSCQKKQDAGNGFAMYISEEKGLSSVDKATFLQNSVIIPEKSLRVDFRYVEELGKPYSVSLYSWIPTETEDGKYIYCEFLGSGILSDGDDKVFKFYPTAGSDFSSDEFTSWVEEGKGKITYQSVEYIQTKGSYNSYLVPAEEAVARYEGFIDDPTYGAIKVFVDNYSPTLNFPRFYPVKPDAQHTVTPDGIGQITLGMKVADIPKSVSGLYLKVEEEQKLGSPVHTLYFTNENGYLVFLARYRDGSDSIEYLEAGRGCRARVNGMWLGSGDDNQFLADNPEAKLITGNPTMEHETWYELGAYMFYIDEGRISGIGLSPKE